MSVCLWQKRNFKPDHKFRTEIERESIFDTPTQLMKPFQMMPRSMTLWLLLWPLIYISKNLSFCHNFWTIRGRAFIIHTCIPCDETCPFKPSFCSAEAKRHIRITWSVCHALLLLAPHVFVGSCWTYWPWPLTYISKPLNFLHTF